MIEKTDAIILKSKKYRDTSKLITLYSKEYGKLNMIAKGSRSKNSKFGGSLETLSYVSIVFYNYPNKEFQYITQASINDFFHKIHGDINKTMTAMAIAEIVNNTTHPNDKNESIFDLLLNTFSALNDSADQFLRYMVYFQIHYANSIGYSPDFCCCSACGKQIDKSYRDDSIFFNLEGGSVFCAKCAPKIAVVLKKVKPAISRIIRKYSEIESTEIKEYSLPESLIHETFSLLHLYLKNHVTGMKDLKSLDLMFNM